MAARPRPGVLDGRFGDADADHHVGHVRLHAHEPHARDGDGVFGRKLTATHSTFSLRYPANTPPSGRVVDLRLAAAGTSYDGRVSPQVNPWRRHSAESSTENAWIEVLHDEVTRRTASRAIYGVVQLPPLAVGVVPLDVETDRVLLVGPVPLRAGPLLVGDPRRRRNLDESPQEAADASLAEERATPAASGASCAGRTSPTRSATKARSSSAATHSCRRRSHGPTARRAWRRRWVASTRRWPWSPAARSPTP